MIPYRNQFIGWLLLALGEFALTWAEVPNQRTYAWALFALWLVTLCITAWFAKRKANPIGVTRHVDTLQQSGQTFTVILAINNQSNHAIDLHLFDHYPSIAQSNAMPIHIHLEAKGSARIHYPLTISERGRFTFTATQIRYSDRFKLWQYNHYLSNPDIIRVYPRIAQRSYRHLNRIKTRHTITSIHPRPQLSGHGDFAQLRDFQHGDTLNQIDHKASMRLSKWVSRDYESTLQQPIVFMVDSSRRMQTVHQGKNLFDEVLNSTIDLAHTALNTGDEIGLCAFSDHVRRILPCSRRNGQYRRFVEGLFDLKPDQQTCEFSQAIDSVYRLQQQRALIILISTLDLGDERILRPKLSLLSKRHHVMLINIRPPYLNGVHEQNSLASALSSGARDVYANAYLDMERQLRASQLMFFSTPIEHLHVHIINHYLDYKQCVILRN